METIYNPLALPGVTYASTQKLDELLKKNHAFHIYFDGIKHNHIAHNLIAIYTLGATPEDLQAVFDEHSKRQKPLLPQKFKDPAHALSDPKVFAAHMGDNTYYSDYLAFFDHEIQKKGVLPTFQTYYCSGDNGAQMRLQSLSGILHGLIHVGYGIEIEHPLIMAEGLALCAVEQPDCDPATAAFTDIWFDRLPSSSDTDSTDVKVKLNELLTLSFHLYSTTMKEYPGAHFDFFLMHTLTSSYFIPLVLSHVQDVNLQATMLKVCCRWFAIQYIMSGIPKMHSEWLSGPIPTPTLTSDFSWSKIIEHAVADTDEHVAKVIRSLIKLDILNGKQTQQDPFLKLAQMTIGFRKLQDNTTRMAWLMTGIGYEK